MAYGALETRTDSSPGQRALSGLPKKTGWAKSGCKNLNLTCLFVTNMPIAGPSRRDGWILQVRELPVRVSRAPYAIWDSISGCVAPEVRRILEKIGI